MPVLVAGDGGLPLAQKLGRLTGWDAGGADFRTFPDGEDYARILLPIKGQDAVIVQTTYPPSRLWKLLLLLNAARENGARSIRCVVPYLAFARQDRVFQEGEAVSARLAADCIRQYAAEVITVDLHKDEIANYFQGACRHLHAVEPFAKELKAQGVDLVLAPDAGARDRARAVADRMGVPYDHLDKKRVSSETVEIRPKSVPVLGRKVAILDDIISTGGTMARATEQLVRLGATGVLCVGVHGLLLGDVISRLKRAGAADVFVSDTIESAYSRVSVAELIAEALRVPAASSLRR